MTVTEFHLTVTSTSPNVEHLMIVLNPSLIALTGTNYETYYPVVWKILQFTSNSSSLGLPQKSRPIVVDYYSDITAVLQEITDENIVNSADYQAVVRQGEEFLVHSLGGSQYSLVDSGKDIKGCSTAVNNPNSRTFDIGLGDKKGNSYLTLELASQNTLTFTYDAEFAVVPVGVTVQDSTKLVSGSVLRPWFSFKLSDLGTEYPSFTFDGTELVDAKGFVKITPHPSDEVVFGN